MRHLINCLPSRSSAVAQLLPIARTSRTTSCSIRGSLLFARTAGRPFGKGCLSTSSNRTTTTNEPPLVQGTLPFAARGVAVGQVAQLKRSFTADDVAQFGRLIGDFNPLHSDDDDDSDATENDHRHHQHHPLQQSGKIVVHGMLVMSIISSIFGTHVPGSVYLKQTMQFRRPVYVDDVVVGKSTVTSVRRGPRQEQQSSLIVVCDTVIERLAADNDDEDDKDPVVCVEGEAQILVFGGHVLQKDSD